MEDIASPSAAYRHWLFCVATIRKEVAYLDALDPESRQRDIEERDKAYADARKMVSEVRGIPVEKVVIAPVEVALEAYSVWTGSPITKH